MRRSIGMSSMKLFQVCKYAGMIELGIQDGKSDGFSRLPLHY